jgi:hypothetical protein
VCRKHGLCTGSFVLVTFAMSTINLSKAFISTGPGLLTNTTGVLRLMEHCGVTLEI